MNARINLSSPDVTAAESAALQRAMATGWIAPLGPEVDAFEAELAAYAGREHAVALSSGTAALHLALLTMGIGPGSVVLTSSFTFAATTNAITYTGATPVLIDADAEGAISIELLARAIEDQRAKGADLRAIVPVDLLGHVVNHEAIAELAEANGLRILSDAAESFGAVHSGRPSASFGEAAAVSFNGNKIMTTSGGGALLTDDGDFAQHVRYLATQARLPVLHYEHKDIGYNYRLSNLLAALGRAQLERLPAMMERRRQLRLAYKALLADVPGVTFFAQPDGADGGVDHDNFWLTSILIDPAVAGVTRDQLSAHLSGHNMESRPLWKPMHAQPVFQHLDSYVDGTSDRFFEQGVSLPSGSVLTDEEVARVLDTVGDFFRAAA